jgi:Uma2 family endonuclease
MPALPLERDIDYPESDGRPLGETDLHRQEIVDLIHMLERRYEASANVYVSGDLFIYFERGKPSAVVCPDVFVVFGVPKGKRETYKLWDEKVSPSFVIEVTSKSTEDEDRDNKPRKFATLGVEEYFLFDPRDEYLEPQLQGYRWAGGRYRPIGLEPDGSLLSLTTGLRLRAEGEHLRLVDATTGEPLLSTDEEVAVAEERAARAEERAAQEAAARRAAEERAAQETAGRRAAEERAAQEAAALREEIARLRRELDERR